MNTELPPHPPVDFSKPQTMWDFPLCIPEDPRNRRGPTVTLRGRVVSIMSEQAVTKNRYVVHPIGLQEPPAWCGREEVLCKWDPDIGALIALSIASDKDKRRWRVPLFIQSEEEAMCCGRAMSFVGQIDDDTLCTDAQIGAKLWWHDVASFYVYTCSVCLECKAFGQQF